MSESKIVRLTTVFQVLGIFGVINVVIILQKQIIHFIGSFISQLSIISYSINISYLLIDLYTHDQKYFNISFNGAAFYELDPLYFISLIFGDLTILLTIFIIIFEQKHLSHREDTRNIFVIMVFYTILAFFVPSVMLILNFKVGLSIPVFLYSSMMAVLIPISSAILAYATYTVPSINLLSAFNVEQAIKQGQVGYMLAYTFDGDVQIPLYSIPFVEKRNLTLDMLAKFSIRAMMTFGSDENQWEGMYLIPFSPLPSFFAFCFNFVSKNPQAHDFRLRTHTPVMLTIFISKATYLRLRDIDSAYHNLKKITKQYPFVQDLINKDAIIDLVSNILKSIIYVKY